MGCRHHCRWTSGAGQHIPASCAPAAGMPCIDSGREADYINDILLRFWCHPVQVARSDTKLLQVVLKDRQVVSCVCSLMEGLATLVHTELAARRRNADMTLGSLQVRH